MRDSLLQIGPARPAVEAGISARACRDGVPAACVMTVSVVRSRVLGRVVHRSDRPWASRRRAGLLGRLSRTKCLPLRAMSRLLLLGRRRGAAYVLRATPPSRLTQ